MQTVTAPHVTPSTHDPARLQQTTVILATHVLVTGPFHDLRRYLLQQPCRTLLCMWHPLQPFSTSGCRASGYERYGAGRRQRTGSMRQPPLPSGKISEFVLYVWHNLLTMWWGITQARGAELMIAINPLNGLAGLALRRLRIVRHVIYYTIDYVPNRFPHRWLNALYHWADRTCVGQCDQVWNLSSRMVPAREARGVSPRHRRKQVTVPIGTDLHVIPAPLDQLERYTYVYFGGLMEKQGVQLGIEALPLVHRRIPQAKFLIIGGGQPDRYAALRRLAEELGVAQDVTFTGVIDDHDEALRRLSRCAIGIAPYTGAKDNYTQNTDPGKPKAYLAAGLPVLITDVPEVARTIQQAGAGDIIPYDATRLAHALSELMLDTGRLAECKHRARALAERYDWNRVFAQAFTAWDHRGDA